MLFKDYFHKVIERQIEQLPRVLSKDYKPEIACIFFAYHNKELIGMLEKRGKSINNLDLKGIEKHEIKINKLLKNEKKVAEFMKPCQAFIIFSNQEGFERCMQHCSTSKGLFGQIVYNESDYALTVMDEKLEVREAPEPTDIIWENLQNDYQTTKTKEGRTFLIIFSYFAFLFMILVYGIQFVDNS